MKKIVEEVEGEGLEALLGETVHIICCRYIYRGKLVGVSDTSALIEGGIVYETGPLNGEPKDYQEIESPVYVQNEAIESFWKAVR